MPHDYIPRPDGDFSTWANHYYESVKKWWETNGLNTSELKPLEQALSAWNADYPAHVAAQNAAQAAAGAKTMARRQLEPEARRIAAFVQSFLSTTNADRATLGISLRTPGRTPGRTPATRPRVSIESGQRLTHTLRLHDEAAQTRSAKPRGTLGAEVWMKVGKEPPIDESQLRFVNTATRSSFQVTFPSEAGRQTAYYWLRWVSPTGERGPWSQLAQATIAA